MPAAFDPAEVPDLAPLIDHALLQPRLGRGDVERGCQQALHFGFAGICLASRWMPEARQWLGDRGSVRLISVLSFPFGACSSAVKRAEAEAAVEAGADELDLVPDFALLLDGELTALHDQIAAVVELGLPLKLILEADQLSSDQLQMLVEVALDAGVAFLKTGSGYGNPASSAIGAITCNCKTAMWCNSELKPGPTRVIKGSAATTSTAETPNKRALTLVFRAAST